MNLQLQHPNEIYRRDSHRVVPEQKVTLRALRVNMECAAIAGIAGTERSLWNGEDAWDVLAAEQPNRGGRALA